ncbi:hypothetical protein PL325_15585 [Clostridium perfringens D]|nr:hypothetical protein PL325_15585 [Clostridium perfringens D]
MNNTCKKKGCNNEALNGSKYCNYHQSKREDTKKMIINGASALATFVIAIALKNQERNR